MTMIVLFPLWWKGKAYFRRASAGICFALIMLKFATRLDFPLWDRWLVMIFAYVGTVYLIDGIRAKDSQ